MVKNLSSSIYRLNVNFQRRYQFILEVDIFGNIVEHVHTLNG